MGSGINIEILKKYDKPVPRYTSYPTAPIWGENFTADQYIEHIRISNALNNDLSLYFHLPFCNTLCWYCGCNVIITKNPDKIANYIDYLKKEIDLVTKHLSPNRRVVQMHWGGGTPNSMSPAQMKDICGYIYSKFNFVKDAEISMEVDPRDMTLEHILAMREAGFNRISMGVQDLDPAVQKAIHRIQPVDMTAQVIKWARANGFESANVDLIYGLPLQTLETFGHTIDEVIKLNPDRIALFNYAHVPWLKKHQKLIKIEQLPSKELKLDIFKLAVEKFTKAGYVFIGMDHFAKPDDELSIAQQNKTLYRNFQGYTTKAGTEMLGMGITSIGNIGDAYIQNYREYDLDKYYASLDAGVLPVHKGYVVNDDDKLRKEVITRIMCDFELTKADIEKRFNIKFDEYFATELTMFGDFIEDGFVTLQPDKIIVHEPGRLFIRNIASVFDIYLRKPATEQNKPTFSRSV